LAKLLFKGHTVFWGDLLLRALEKEHDEKNSHEADWQIDVEAHSPRHFVSEHTTE